MKRYCLTLDLKEDAALIEEYKEHHRRVWPEVQEGILRSGILSMDIYLLGTRLVMIVEATESFSFEAKAKEDAGNERISEWEALMWRYQQALPVAAPGQKWIPMEKIFSLSISEDLRRER